MSSRFGKASSAAPEAPTFSLPSMSMLLPNLGDYRLVFCAYSLGSSQASQIWHGTERDCFAWLPSLGTVFLRLIRVTFHLSSPFIHILRVHLKVSLPQIRSQVCFSHAVWIRVFISVKYKACTKIHTLHFRVQLCPLPVEGLDALSIKSLWHMSVCSHVWYMCSYAMYVTAPVLSSKDNLQKLVLSSTFWGLGTELRLFPLEASAFAHWAISGS